MGLLSASRVVALAVASVALLLGNLAWGSSWRDANFLAVWVVAQWLPLSSLQDALHSQAWGYWEEMYGNRTALTRENLDLKVPVVDVQEHKDNLKEYIEETFGKDWRKRPLKLQGLWNQADLESHHRRLSLEGLLKEDLEIPYFTDARRDNALSPDASDKISSIVSNITKGSPHKIGTQFVVQRYPELVDEIAPTDLLTDLFGDFFAPDRVRGFGPGLLLPALTTVPLFIASGSSMQQQSATGDDGQPYTALHCEPIGNVAVQLSGTKKWTMVDPIFSFLIRPSTAPDGRAFFASWKSINTVNVPTYTGLTSAGDAMWVPTWTWHRVDYIASKDIAIGGSLFHFRPFDYVANNPLFAILMIPAILQEVLGIKSQ